MTFWVRMYIRGGGFVLTEESMIFEGVVMLIFYIIEKSCEGFATLMFEGLVRFLAEYGLGLLGLLFVIGIALEIGRNIDEYLDMMREMRDGVAPHLDWQGAAGSGLFVLADYVGDVWDVADNWQLALIFCLINYVVVVGRTILAGEARRNVAANAVVDDAYASDDTDVSVMHGDSEYSAYDTESEEDE